MATHNDEALDLKRRARRRLIGAIALVLFLVIVPPWIMDLEPQPVTTSLDVEIPKPAEQPLSTLPHVAEAPAAQEEALATAVPPPADPPPAPAAAEPAPAPQPPAKPATPPAPLKAAEAPAKETYIVPVATLANKSNVKQLQDRIKDAGIKSYTEAVNTGSGPQTRVRAGPFPTQAAAEKARKQLQGMGLKPGNVTTR